MKTHLATAFLLIVGFIGGFYIGYNQEKPFEVKSSTFYFKQDGDKIYQIHKSGDTLAIGRRVEK